MKKILSSINTAYFIVSLLLSFCSCRPNNDSSTVLETSIINILIDKKIAVQDNDRMEFLIPFDMYGFESGASCLKTDFAFSIPAKRPKRFPKTISATIREYGCVDKESLIAKEFTLVEKENNAVNYFSKELSANLILNNQGIVYYYPHESESSISIHSFKALFETSSFSWDDVPFMSSMLMYESKN